MPTSPERSLRAPPPLPAMHPGRLRAVTAVLLTVGALAGCALPASAPPPEPVPLPERFSEGGDSPLPEAWWKHFGDPRLEGLVDRALGGNFSLAAARSRLMQARAVARREGAASLPSTEVTLDAEGTRRQGRTDESYALGAAAGYELDLWGRVESTAAAARLDATARRADLEAAAITVSAEVATAYYSLLRQRALAELLLNQLETSRRIVELVALRVRNGEASTDELLRQRQLVAQTESLLVVARTEAERHRNRLAALLGRPPQDAEIPDGHDLVDLPPLPDTGIPAEWLRRRPDLKAARLRLRAADERAAAAVAARFPRVDLRLATRSTAGSPGMLLEEWTSSLTAGLVAPLFDGGALEADADRAAAAVTEALNDYADTVLEAVVEVEDALATEQGDRQRLASLESQLALAERVFAQLRTRYVNGAVGYLDVLTAQSSLQETQRTALEARWTLVLDRVALSRALAGGWEGSDTPSILDTTEIAKAR